MSPATHMAPAVETPAAGALDGLTLFRFAHMFRNPHAGGMERYLDDLNRRLLERNRMRIMQLYLTTDSTPPRITVEPIGRGELLWIPSTIKPAQLTPTTRPGRFLRTLKRRLTGDPFVCHDVLLSELERFAVNLAVFHWISEDSRIVLRALAESATPFVVVNHFENGRLRQRLIRRQIAGARVVSGVSGVDVPRFLKRTFVSVSDGIDTDFFARSHAAPIDTKIEGPVVLLPSRVTEGKGHLEAVRALARLSRDGVKAGLAFAGRVESDRLVSRLTREIARHGLQDRAVFLGELSAEALRSWYAAAAVVVLTTHSEGLGRVLLEAQAMQTPVVAYDVGGVREAVAHGEGGYLVRRGDSSGLAIRIRELLEDETLRRRMAVRGRDYVLERFSLEALATRHEQLYAEALGLRRTG